MKKSLALEKPNGHTHVYIYENEQAVLDRIRLDASNRTAGFTWFDAAVLSQQLRHEKNKSVRNLR